MKPYEPAFSSIPFLFMFSSSAAQADPRDHAGPAISSSGMNKYILIAALSIFTFPLSIFNSFAQVPTIQWQKALGGTNEDWATSIEQTTDGGYIVAGRTLSNDGDVTGNHAGWDYWVVKLSDTGAIEWQKALGGFGNDLATSIKQTIDGGYIVAGSSTSNDGDVTGNHGEQDYWVVKLTSSGAIDWQRSLGGTGRDEAYSIEQTTDGGYVVAGISGSNDGDVTGDHGDMDYWVVKLTSTGAIDWQKALGGTAFDGAYSIKETSEGGYIVAGASASNDGDLTGNHGGGEQWVVKLTGTGTIEWQKALGGTGVDRAFSIAQTDDSGYIVAGASSSTDGDVTGNHGGGDQWVVKLTDTGAIDWQRALGGTGYDEASSIEQTTDGGYIVTGSTGSNDGDVSDGHGALDHWVVKLTNTGAIDWQKALGGTGYDLSHCIKQTTEGGFIVAGSSSSNDGDVTGNHGDYDFWVVKLSDSEPTSIERNTPLISCSIYPNPAETYIWIETAAITTGVPFQLIDVAGRTVLRGVLYQEASRVDVSHLVEGVYSVEILGSKPQKLVKR